jgi:dTDP-4-dehydrorhamnose reductase
MGAILKRILVTGASGFLGSHIARHLAQHSHDVMGTFSKHEDRLHTALGGTAVKAVGLDLSKDNSMESVLGDLKPDIVVHAAALADLKSCQEKPDIAEKINVRATCILTRLCSDQGARLIFLSTDQVFDGEKGDYNESHAPHPIHIYGQTKAKAEQAVLGMPRSAGTVVRVALTYGKSPTGLRSSTEQILAWLERGERPRLFVDEIRSPILAEDVASAVCEMVHQEVPLNLLHLAGPHALSRFEMGQSVAEAFGYEASLIQGVKQADLNLIPPRPRDLSFNVSLARKTLAHPPRDFQQGLAWLTKRDSG